MAESIDKVGAAEAAPSPLTPFSEEELLEKWAGAPEPVVSIVCWTYNHAPFIRAALDGILGQDTDFPFEVLVRDDASNDGTADIVREYAARYPRVVRAVLEPTNTYSRGIKPPTVLLPLARGEFVAVCEGDDYWIDRRKLALQVQALRDAPDAVMCFHHGIAIRGTAIAAGTWIQSPNTSYISQSEMMRAASTTPWFPSPLTWMYRRGACDYTVPEISEFLSVDWLFYSQLARSGAAIFFPQPMAAYRIHGGSAWSSLSANRRAWEAINSALWISGYHFRTGSCELGRAFAHRAAHDFVSCVWSRNPRVGVWFGLFALVDVLSRAFRRLSHVVLSSVRRAELSEKAL